MNREHDPANESARVNKRRVAHRFSVGGRERSNETRKPSPPSQPSTPPPPAHETPGAAQDANEARKHADAIRRHRQHVADRIAELERRQDELLDQLAADR